MTGTAAGIGASWPGPGLSAIRWQSLRALRQGLRIVFLKTSNLFTKLFELLLKVIREPVRMLNAVEKYYKNLNVREKHIRCR